jgi:hypothetical protein
VVVDSAEAAVAGVVEVLADLEAAGSVEAGPAVAGRF